MTATKDSLKVTQFISGQREKVFQAWIDPVFVKRWLCPEQCRVTFNKADVRVGGKYRESMKCGADIHTVHGAYREIIPNEKLVFTHQWEEPDPTETVVAVKLTDKNGGTEVTLSQHGFIDSPTAKGHEEGWTSALRNLAKQFQ